jgi:hypothetical protein
MADFSEDGLFYDTVTAGPAPASGAGMGPSRAVSAGTLNIAGAPTRRYFPRDPL